MHCPCCYFEGSYFFTESLQIINLNFLIVSQKKLDRIFTFSFCLNFRFLDRSLSRRTGFKPGTGSWPQRPRNDGTEWCTTSSGRLTRTTSRQHTNRPWVAVGTSGPPRQQGLCHSTTVAILPTWDKWRHSFPRAWATTRTTIPAACRPGLRPSRSARPRRTCRTCRPRWSPERWLEPFRKQHQHQTVYLFKQNLFSLPFSITNHEKSISHVILIDGSQIRYLPWIRFKIALSPHRKKLMQRKCYWVFFVQYLFSFFFKSKEEREIIDVFICFWKGCEFQFCSFFS